VSLLPDPKFVDLRLPGLPIGNRWKWAFSCWRLCHPTCPAQWRVPALTPRLIIWPKPPHYEITVPWLNIGVALVVVPVVATLGAGLLTRSRRPSERRAD
jgi:hypothetical protein